MKVKIIKDILSDGNWKKILIGGIIVIMLPFLLLYILFVLHFFLTNANVAIDKITMLQTEIIG